MLGQLHQIQLTCCHFAGCHIAMHHDFSGVFVACKTGMLATEPYDMDVVVSKLQLLYD